MIKLFLSFELRQRGAPTGIVACNSSTQRKAPLTACREPCSRGQATWGKQKAVFKGRDGKKGFIEYLRYLGKPFEPAFCFLLDLRQNIFSAEQRN